MLDDVFDFVLKLIVVFLDLLQPHLLVALELLVDLENTNNLFLLCCNHVLQNRNLILVVTPQVALSL